MWSWKWLALWIAPWTVRRKSSSSMTATRRRNVKSVEETAPKVWGVSHLDTVYIHLRVYYSVYLYLWSLIQIPNHTIHPSLNKTERSADILVRWNWCQCKGLYNRGIVMKNIDTHSHVQNDGHNQKTALHTTGRHLWLNYWHQVTCRAQLFISRLKSCFLYFSLKVIISAKTQT